MTNNNAEPLLPVELGAGKVKFAQGIKAGRWVFATGVMAQDFKNGIAPDVLVSRDGLDRRVVLVGAHEVVAVGAGRAQNRVDVFPDAQRLLLALG